MVGSAGSGSPQSAIEQRGKLISCRFERKVTRTVGYAYLLYLPPDYTPQTPVPLVLFLHGAGERGSDLNLVKQHGPPRLVQEGQSFPFILVSPQCPDNKWWEADHLNALLDEIMQTYAVDPNRVYATGLSMGGFGTWTLGVISPERFAALVPVCGWGEPFAAFRLKDIPIWAFHGEKDPIVPVSKSVEMVDAVKRAGGNPRLTLYPDAEHDSWTATYDNPEVYSWLLKQTRTQRKGDGHAGKGSS
jgi:predicted peptidase